MKLKPTILLQLLVLFAIASWTACPVEAAKPYQRGPYLALGTPNSMTIVWRTERAIQPVVRIGWSPRLLNRVISGGAINARTAKAGDHALSTAPAGSYQYEATITGLSPDT